MTVAGRERLVVQGLRTLLTTLPGIEVVDLCAELVVLAIDPGEAASRVDEERTRHAEARVVCLASAWTADEASAALSSGASGCLLTDTSADGLSTALRQAARGEITLPAELMRAIVATSVAPDASPIAPLSERETDVLVLVAQGHPNKEIAQQLLLSVRTVEHHLESIYAKLGVHSRTEAAVIAVREGLATADR